MNNFITQNAWGAKFIVLVTLCSLVLSAFPASFFVAEAASDVSVFADGFETNDFSAWTSADSRWQNSGGAVHSHSGTRGARVHGAEANTIQYLTKTVSTVGFENIDLSLWYKTTDLELGESLSFEWYDGTSWSSPIIIFSGITGNDEVSDWVSFTSSIPSGANNLATFAFRLVGNLDSGGDQVWVDDVRLAGDDIAPTVVVPTCEGTDSVADTTFDTFDLGDVDAQNNWKSTGAYDQEIVENTYGYTSFGCQSLRLSNAVTTGAFGDQTFAAPFADSVGEVDATAGTFTEGTRFNRYEAEFDIASTDPDAQQPGLFISVSPDRGDGSRMSYLGFGDVSGGIEVTFYDAQGNGPVSFVPTVLTTLDRSEPHTIKFVMQMNDGPSNDVVEIYIDGVLEHTGGSWENYFRYSPESVAEQTPRLIKTLLFRSGGTAAPATSGEGFLFDNLSLKASNTVVEPKDEIEIDVTGNTSAGENQPGWLFNRDTNTDTPIEFNNDEASLDVGSLNVLPIGANAADKFVGEYFYLDTLSSLDSFKYDFKIGAGGDSTDEEQFYANVYVNFPESSPTKFYDCRYNVIPTVGSTAGFTTVTFDPSVAPYSVTKSGSSPRPTCPAIPADMGADAVVRMIAINLGDGSASDVGIDGYFDNVVVETTDLITTYDFEPIAPVATVIATKLVCTDEADLPNWGTGSPDITSTTAADWIANGAHPSCSLQEGFAFEWAGADVADPRGTVTTGSAGAGWRAFDSVTSATGTAVLTLTEDDIDGDAHIWVREILPTGFLPFSWTDAPDNSNPVSAEFYCSVDGVNYDNWDRIDSIAVDETYHCVAFNVPTTPVVPNCEVGDNLLLNGNFENPEVLNDTWDVYESGTSGLQWLVSWVSAFIGAPEIAKVELQENVSGWTANSGDQYAELDGDWGYESSEQSSVKIAQTVATEVGATYELRYAFSPRPNTGIGENALQVAIGGFSAPLLTADGTGNTNTNWTIHTNEFIATTTSTEISFADAGTPNSVGTFLDNAVLCKTKEAPKVPSVTVTAFKVMCEAESDLPNGQIANPVTVATAQAWVDQSDGDCWLEEGWDFEYGAAGAGNGGDTTIGHAPNYTTFGPTSASGSVSVVIPMENLGGRVEMREVLKPGYIPFAGDLRAEFYCHTDAAGTDNWDWVNGIVDGGAYACVAFNAPDPTTTGTLEITKYACPANTDVVRSENGVGGDVPEDCVPQTGASFAYAYGTQTDANAPYPELTAPVTDLGETVAGSLVVPNLLASGRYLIVETDEMGNKLPADAILGLYCEGDGDTSNTNDNQELTFIEPGETTKCVAYNKLETVPQCTLTLESDDDTVVVTNNDYATSTYNGHPSWTANIPGATWIWDSFYAEDTDENVTRTFEETFTADNPLSAKLDIAADNTYKLFINGELVLDRDNENNYGDHATLKGVDVLEYLNATGTNTMRVEVTNTGVNGSNQFNNPAGLLYKLVVIGSDNCAITTEPEDEVIIPDPEVATTTPTTTPTTTEPVDDTPDTTSNRRSGGGGTRVTLQAPVGQVLGATDMQCSIYLTEYMRLGAAASSTQVMKLQIFLNAVGLVVPITSVFDAATDEAVRAFQLQHQAEVLTPWYMAGIVPHNNPTGWVYQLTRWKINNIVCPGSEAYPVLS